MRSFLVLSLLIGTLFGGAMTKAQGAPDASSTSQGIFSNSKLVGGMRAYNVSGRGFEFDDANGRRFYSKDEFYLGFKDQSGWGASAMAVSKTTSHGDYNKNRSSAADPSLTITHPLFDNGKLTITGQFREYFPVSDYSVSKAIWQQAYYSFLHYRMASKLDLKNTLIPRYFSASTYAPGDTTFYTEDYLTLTRQETKWLRYGIGQHAQVEVHPITPVGKTVELYPMADLMLSNTVFMGPRVYFPIFTQNSVYDAPRNVGTDNVQFELYIQATL